MRPAGDCHLALLQAAHAVRLERLQNGAPGQGATLREMVQRSQVGYAVARTLVAKLHQRGQLTKVGEVRVEYRNRPVALYAPANSVPNKSAAPGADLARAMQSWVTGY